MAPWREGYRKLRTSCAKDVRRRFTTPTGQWLPVTAGEIKLKRIAAIPIVRYRYRGSKIPSPWVLHHT